MDFKNYNRETEDIKNKIILDRQDGKPRTTETQIIEYFLKEHGYKIPEKKKTMSIIINTRQKVKYTENQINLNEIGE